MARLAKHIVESRTKDLPEEVAERLQGFNGTPDQFATNIVADLLRGYLRKNYGSREFWMPHLQRMLDNKDRMGDDPHLLAAVKQVIKEVNGTEAL